MSDIENSGQPASEATESSVEESSQIEEGQEVAAEDEASSSEGQSEEERLAELSEKDPSEMSKDEKKEQQKLVKKFKLKVDGEEFEEEIDLSDEEAVKKHLQFSKAAQKRMQETAQVKKAAEQLVDMLRKDPKKVLSDPNIGVDLKEFAASILNEIAEEEAKTPEQREIDNLRKQLEERISKEKEEEDLRNSREMERLQSETESKIESGITSALEQGGLPKTPYTVKKMAEAMMIALQNDIDLDPADVVPLVRKQMQDEIKEMFSSSSDDVLEELLGKDTVSRLHKRRLSKVKKTPETASAVKPTGEDVKPKTSEAAKKQTIRDFFGV